LIPNETTSRREVLSTRAESGAGSGTGLDELDTDKFR